jgi:hypothetical protein
VIYHEGHEVHEVLEQITIGGLTPPMPGRQVSSTDVFRGFGRNLIEFLRALRKLRGGLYYRSFEFQTSMR